MNENLNLVEILKDCPEGTKLYSPVLGEVDFLKISDDDISFPIRVRVKYGMYTFSSQGRFCNIEQGECLLFPSKDQRDWSKFKVKKPKFDPRKYVSDVTLSSPSNVIHFENGAKWADKNPNSKTIAEYLYKEKGYPISLNGDIPTYEEVVKHVQAYNNYKMRQKTCDGLGAADAEPNR